MWLKRFLAGALFALVAFSAAPSTQAANSLSGALVGNSISGGVSVTAGIGPSGPSHSPVILHLNFAAQSYYPTTLAKALIVSRPDNQIALTQNADGTWDGWPPNTARISIGNGIRYEPQATNRLRWANVYANAVWSATGLALSDAGDNPINGTQPVIIQVLAPGTTAVSVPADTTLTAIYVRGGSGVSTDGVINTNSGATGGSAAFSAKTTTTSLGSCTSITVQVPTSGSQAAALVKDCSGTVVASADSGSNASGITAGTGGALANGVGNIKRSGANGAAANVGAGNRAAPGGSGSANDATVGGANANGRQGCGGNTLGGGGGNSPGGGVTPCSAAATGVGGVGGTNLSNTGNGVGGTLTVAPTDGTNGGAGAGALNGSTALNGSNGSCTTWTIASGLFTQTTPGAGAGGGGGAAGGGGGAGCGGGSGGAGGSTATTAGVHGAGSDGVVILVYGASNATRLTATAANATLSQALTLASFDTTSSMMIRPSHVTGPIYLTSDNCATLNTNTDISSQLIAGRFQQAVAPYQTLGNPTWCLQIANSGDAIDAYGAQLESSTYPTTPIVTTSVAATRNTDFITLNTAALPPFLTNDALTVLLTVYPGRIGTSVTGDVDRSGWSAFSMWGDGTSTAGSFTGSIDNCTPSCGSGGAGNTLNVTAVSSGLIGENCPLVGPGIAPNTYTTAQLTGTANGIGTYAVSVIQTVASSALTTTNGQAIVMNAVVKPPPGLRQNVGTTVVNCSTGLNYGFDPQTAQYVYNGWNRFAFTTKHSTQAGITTLAGNNEFSTPRGSWSDPTKYTGVTLGSQRPTGANSVTGYIGEITLLNALWGGNQMSGWASPRRRPRRGGERRIVRRGRKTACRKRAA